MIKWSLKNDQLSNINGHFIFSAGKFSFGFFEKLVLCLMIFSRISNLLHPDWRYFSQISFIRIGDISLKSPSSNSCRISHKSHQEIFPFNSHFSITEYFNYISINYAGIFLPNIFPLSWNIYPNSPLFI